MTMILLLGRIASRVRKKSVPPWRKQWLTAHPLAEFGYALGLLQNDARIVGGCRPSGLTLVHDPGVRPVRYARTAAATFVVAHHRSPFGAVDVAMRIGRWCLIRVDRAVMPGPDDVRDFVRD